uniref:Non-specific serine/threonine protein kinase n=1 Tax=Anopheles culicifacies TaxID=139723 RepID=A0A182M5Q2_9DIPT
MTAGKLKRHKPMMLNAQDSDSDLSDCDDGANALEEAQIDTGTAPEQADNGRFRRIVKSKSEPSLKRPFQTAQEMYEERKKQRERERLRNDPPFGLPDVDELEELLATLEEYELQERWNSSGSKPPPSSPVTDGSVNAADEPDIVRPGDEHELMHVYETIDEIMLVLHNEESCIERCCRLFRECFPCVLFRETGDKTSYTYAQFQKTGKLTAPATVIPRFRKYNVDDFHFLTVLGKGSFGKVMHSPNARVCVCVCVCVCCNEMHTYLCILQVFLAELKNSDYYYAIKCLKKDVVLEDDDVDCTLIERKVLALGTKHPFLCHLFCTFQTDSHLFFVMEYLNGGDLMFHIQQSGRFPEARARFYAAEIVSGLKFLHRKGIVYRDLKLDNVLLDYDGHVRIADFGMCKLEIYLDKLADSFCGTPDYMAPEIIKGQKYNQAVDWWSFGVLVYEMLVGQSPFSGCDEDELFWSICNEIPWFPHYLSKEALRLLQSLLEKDASIRLGVLNTMDEESDIKYHPFFNSIIWDKLERRAVEPPFKPQVRHPLDTQYFDKQFTRERARLTPIDRNILASMDQAQFEGFTYTNPNNTLT